MLEFVWGAIMATAVFVGLFFFKFWRKTGDRLFLIFAIAFWLLAIERWTLLGAHMRDETNSYIFLIRLVAFVVIIWGVYDKNRRTRARG